MHRRTAQCKKVVEQNRQRLSTEEEGGVSSRAFSAYGRPLDMVTSFKYLGQVISASDGDCPEVIRNLDKAQAVWQRLMRILSREGAAPWVYGFFFKAMVHSMLIFGAETWVVTPRMGRVLVGFSRTRWKDG